jgi:hypothetical protein
MTEYKTYLAHHGVKGMKWGVRRYQNPDGSLTAAGKKRQEKADFKSDLKTYRKADKGVSDALYNLSQKHMKGQKENRDAAIDAVTKLHDVKTSIASKNGEAYLNRVMNKSRKVDDAVTVSVVAGLSATAAGLMYLKAHYGVD